MYGLKYLMLNMFLRYGFYYFILTVVSLTIFLEFVDFISNFPGFKIFSSEQGSIHYKCNPLYFQSCLEWCFPPPKINTSINLTWSI